MFGVPAEELCSVMFRNTKEQELGASEILQSSKDCLLFSHACKDPNEKGTKKCWEDNSTKTYHETHD